MLEIAQLFICKKLKQQHQFKPRKMLNTYISTVVNFIKNLMKVSLSRQSEAINELLQLSINERSITFCLDARAFGNVWYIQYCSPYI